MIESLGPGGAERALVDLCAALQDRGHECAIASIQPRLELASEAASGGTGVYSLGLESPRSLGFAALRLRRLLVRLEPDVVHAHLYFAELATAAATLGGLPARVVTFHNMDFDAYPVNSAWRRFRRRLERMAVSGFEAHLAGGEAIARHYSAHLRLQGITPIPYASMIADQRAPSTELRGQQLAELGIDPSRPLILLPGSFKPEKGHRHLVEALALLRDDGLDVQAAFTSDGPLREEVHAQVSAAGLLDAVHFLGMLPSQTDVIRLMALADLVALPSAHEGYPISAIEAMAAETAVVAFAVGGLEELIDDGVTGRLVPPGSSRELAVALSELLEDPERRAALAIAGASAVRNRHRPSVVAERHEEVYLEAIGLRRSRRGSKPRIGDPAARSRRLLPLAADRG